MLGLWLRAVRLSPETYTLVSDGALSHLMREMGINLIVRLISGN
ncbi:unnamed protein product [marine sediment metagenome]|uniref:Uncharacterized protein n=1 Tax=marine sediment metagenome TaxID=412755 RepID=X1A634_9ZZZZ